MSKSPGAFRTISEVSDWLDTPAHVLRFWESRFTQVKPVKRAGGRRYYRPSDMLLLGGIKKLLHEECITIRGVQKILREKGVRYVAALSPELVGAFDPSSKTTESERVPTTEEELAQGDIREPSHHDTAPEAEASMPEASPPDTAAATPERSSAANSRSTDTSAKPEPAAVTASGGETGIQTNAVTPTAIPEDVMEDGFAPQSTPFVTRLRDLATIGGTPQGEARDRLHALYTRLHTLRDRVANSANGYRKPRH